MPAGLTDDQRLEEGPTGTSQVRARHTRKPKPRPPSLGSAVSNAAARHSPGSSPNSAEAGSSRKDRQLKPASPWTREMDFTEVIYTPHTVVCLVGILLTVLLMLRYYSYPDMNLVSKVKLGLSAAVFVFVGFGAVNLPDSLLVRPHPAVWRAVLACGLVYMVLLTFMLFMDLGTAKMLVGLYDPALRTPLPERSYATDCRLRTEEDPYLFVHTAFDVFIIAHALGYVFKTLVLRDWRVVTCVSLGFEVIEVSFQHVLPNFRECWWDHLLLDVLICNLGGTIAGMWLLRQLRAKRYHWTALREIPTVKGKAQRLLEQLGPRSFQTYEWNVFESPTRFFQVCVVLALMFLQEVNCFTMKAILDIPANHHLVAVRLGLMCLLAMPALREFYEFVANPAVKRIGTTFWVTILTLALETLWITKMMMEGHYFREPMPVYIAVPWVIVLASFGLWLLLFFGALSRQQRVRRRGFAYHAVNIFFWLAAAAVTGLFCMGMPDLQLGRHRFEQFIAPYEGRILFWRGAE